jgi:RNA polymerase sigma-70 factor (ECF subfamily)
MLRPGVLRMSDRGPASAAADRDALDERGAQPACGEPPQRELPWREVRAELRRFVAARVPLSDVEDVVQEALARIHRGVASVRDHDRLAPWMYQVTRNVIVDHHRRTRPALPLADDPIAEPVTDEADTGLAQMLAHCMSGFVAMLPAVYRQAITLVELEGLSQVEAAARLGVPVSTMKARVRRGRLKLRELVETCCAIGLDARGHVIEATPRGGTCVSC